MSFVPFSPTIFVGILSCRGYTTGLTSKVADVCGCACKRLRSDKGNASHGPSKSSCRDTVDRARASRLSEMDLDDIPMPRRGAVGSDNHSVVVVGVPRYVGSGY